MAKTLHCDDIMPGCDYVAKGDSESDVLRQAAEHARTVHSIAEITPELVAQVQSKIRDEVA